MRTLRIISVALCCVVCLSLAAAPVPKKQQQERVSTSHYIGPFLMAGYDNMLKLDPRLQNIGGPMGGLGFAYQFRYGTYDRWSLLLKADAEAQYGLNIRKGTFNITRRVLQPSDEMFLSYQFPALSERQQALDVSASLMVGGQYKGVFFFTGARLGYPVGIAGYSVESRVDRIMYDARAIDDYTEMPHHLLGSETVNGSGSLARKLNAFWALEVGYDFFRPQQQPLARGRDNAPQKRTFRDYAHWQLSAFVNVGLMDYKASPDEPLVVFDGGEGVSQLRSTSNALEFASARTIPVIAGLKFALFFELQQKQKKQVKQPAESEAMIVTYVRDELTDQPIGGATVKTRPVTKGKKKKKTVVKTTDNESGCVAKAFAPGKYRISASHPGYFPMEPVLLKHGESDDTLQIALYPQLPLRSQVVDAKTGRPVTAQVTVYDQADTVIFKGSVDSIQTLLSTLVDDRKEYSVCVTAEGYRDTCTTTTAGNIADVLVIRLEPIHVRKFVLQNMFFATDKTDILPSSESALQELYNLLNDNPNIRIRIIGHTDDVGKDDYNWRLSKGRSESVKQEMVKRGIDAARIETTGRGEQDPIVPNDSDEHRQMNRRVEIEILNGEAVRFQISDEQLTK